jgi:TPR repeat protein
MIMKKLLTLLLTLFLFNSVYAEDLIKLSLDQAKAGNFEQAKEIIINAAEDGDAEAQWLLSRFHVDPNGFNQPKIGEQWMIRSAINGYRRAQLVYGWELSLGWKTSPIEKLSKAVYWYEKAGYNGSDVAYANLGALYDNDERNVLKEIEELANKGDAMAQYNIGWINGRGLLTEDGLKQDEDVAKAWFEKSAEQGFQDAVDILKKNF